MDSVHGSNICLIRTRGGQIDVSVLTIGRTKKSCEKSGRLISPDRDDRQLFLRISGHCYAYGAFASDLKRVRFTIEDTSDTRKHSTSDMHVSVRRDGGFVEHQNCFTRSKT